ncbi:hypothetical protein CPC08DRAFT_595006, partial [Agrocybe pediades]
HKVRLVQRTKDRGILVEMDSEEGAAWLRRTVRKGQLSRDLGAQIKDRHYHLLVKFAPITFDEDMEIQEVLDVNNIDPEKFFRARWIKPKNRRRPDQKSGHMVFIFSDRDQANEICI